MVGKESGPSDFSHEELSHAEKRAQLVESIQEFESQGDFFAEYVEILKNELSKLDHQQDAA
ncbi:MAG: hypothetical protein JWO07_131 [Candidatus Saccharibacteria bacterium]|nr:hypothetical protein [Candidatus Saccharibacteria bacterium]